MSDTAEAMTSPHPSSLLSSTFTLDEAFLRPYVDAPCPLDADPMAKLVFLRTYSRGGGRESWFDVIRRVVEGTFRAIARQISSSGGGAVPSSVLDLKRDAESMFDTFYRLRALPPGRGLWAMGTPITETKGMGAPLNNCAFVSTESITAASFAEPFTFLMDASMLGCGVGIDTRGAVHHIPLRRHPTPAADASPYVVEDSREGWVESVKALLDSYAPEGPSPAEAIVFDYSRIRPKGAAISTFGGITSGPGALRDLHESLRKVLDAATHVTSTVIADVANLIGVAVISGNVRRTAEIIFGDPDDAEFVKLKDYGVNPHRAAFGWTSNNSLFARVGQSYDQYTNSIATNGEPGFVWLENARAYGRFGHKSERDDGKIAGTNPCGEIGLESGEFCNLAEVFPCAAGGDYAVFEESLRVAFLYAKAVTLFPMHWESSAAVVDRNRRIGVGLSGIAQFLSSVNGSGSVNSGDTVPSSEGGEGGSLGRLREWCTRGYAFLAAYDAELSAALGGIPVSIKRTTIKPSGTVSLLAGATPGLHYPIAPWYIRRVTLSGDSPYVPGLKAAGYVIEPSAYDADSVVVEFPCSSSSSATAATAATATPIRAQSSVSMWEQLELAAFLQEHWSDNLVSATITFGKHEVADIPRALDYYQYRLKGVSLLPAASSSSGDTTGAAAAAAAMVPGTEYLVRVGGADFVVFGGSEEENVIINAVRRRCSSFSPSMSVRVHKYTPLTPKKLVVSIGGLSTGTPPLSVFAAAVGQGLPSIPSSAAAAATVTLVPLPPYAQMPYEPISEAEYEARSGALGKVDWGTHEGLSPSSSSSSILPPESLLFCDGDKCETQQRQPQALPSFPGRGDNKEGEEEDQ